MKKTERNVLGLPAALCLALCFMGAAAWWKNNAQPRWQHIVKTPQAYPRGTELYYLAWVKHGGFAQKGAAARALSELRQKKYYDLTHDLWSHEEGVIRRMLLLSLFDIKPAVHRDEVLALMTEKDADFGSEGSWVKTDGIFEGKPVDFYFDWGGAAALHLLRHGYWNERATQILLDEACSFYPNHRQQAKKTFDLFAGIPPYDPKPQPRTINSLPLETRKQVTLIKQWFAANKTNLIWSSDKKKYLLKN